MQARHHRSRIASQRLQLDGNSTWDDVCCQNHQPPLTSDRSHSLLRCGGASLAMVGLLRLLPLLLQLQRLLRDGIDGSVWGAAGVATSINTTSTIANTHGRSGDALPSGRIAAGVTSVLLAERGGGVPPRSGEERLLADHPGSADSVSEVENVTARRPRPRPSPTAPLHTPLCAHRLSRSVRAGNSAVTQ